METTKGFQNDIRPVSLTHLDSPYLFSIGFQLLGIFVALN
jgi:hypothetical protein